MERISSSRLSGCSDLVTLEPDVSADSLDRLDVDFAVLRRLLGLLGGTRVIFT